MLRASRQMPFRITTKNVLQFTNNGSWSQYNKQFRPNFLRSTSLLYKLLPTNLQGRVNQPFILFIHHIWGEIVPWGAVFIIQTSDRISVFHNFAIQIALIQYWQATYFSTKNPKNKLAMNNRRLLVADFILYIQWKKTVKNITSWHKTLSASAVKVNKFQDAA